MLTFTSGFYYNWLLIFANTYMILDREILEQAKKR